MCGPDPAVPPSWPAGDAYLRQSEAALPAVTYRDIFRDPRLQALIEQALANNRDLMVAAANIAAAREQYRIQRAQQFPQVDASAGATADSGGERRRRRRRRLSRPASASRASSSTCSAALRSLTHAAAQPLFRDRGGGARDAAALVARHRQRLADLRRRREPAAHRRGHRRQRREERAPDPRAAGGRHRPAHRPAPGGADPRSRPRPTSPTRRRRWRRTSTCSSCWSARRSIRRLLPASIDEAAPTVAELPAGLNSLRPAAPPRRGPGRISAARGQRRRSAPRAPPCSRGSR